jgi:uncharacterized membrane protein
MNQPTPDTPDPAPTSSPAVESSRLSARLRIVMLLLATVGLGVASYLTYVHYSDIHPVCTLGGSCLKVQTSIYSKLAGTPVALIGLIGYLAILASLAAPNGESSRLATATLTLGGFAFSCYLTYRELFSIHAICEWCASSAVIMTILACLAALRFFLGEPPADASPSTPAGIDSRPVDEAGLQEAL